MVTCNAVRVQMLSCGIPELSDLDDLKYVYDALRPHESEADATMYFTRYTHTHDGVSVTQTICIPSYSGICKCCQTKR